MHHLLSKVLLVHQPQVGVVQNCPLALATSAETDPERLAADCGSSSCGRSFLQACPAAAAAAAAAAEFVAVAGSGAAEEAHLQPCEVLVP